MQLTDASGSAVVEAGLLDALVSGSVTTGSLVVSPTGGFIGELGSSKSLSDDTDRAWLSALRRRAQVVLTSGATFRAESYRMPKTADLAVLTKSGVETAHLKPRENQNLHFLQGLDSFSAAIDSLHSLGYKRVHIEFGPTGMANLLSSGLDFTLFLSGPSRESLELGAESLGVQVSHLGKVDALYLAKAR